jgi:hypothetical protein
MTTFDFRHSPIKKSDNVIEPFKTDHRKAQEQHGERSVADDDPLLLANAAFDAAVALYYRRKAIEHDPLTIANIVADGADSEQLAREVLLLPASEARQVLIKLNILENELAGDMDLEAPVDGRHLLMFAALKIDLIKFLAEYS